MLWLKAIHIAAVITWIGGMLLNALIIAILMTERTSSTEGAKGRQPVDLARRLDRTMTAPAMLLAWVLGMTLAIDGGWLSSPWLLTKLAIVIALSGLHGLQAGTLRRLQATPDHTPRALLRWMAPFILMCVTAIAILVAVKPF